MPSRISRRALLASAVAAAWAGVAGCVRDTPAGANAAALDTPLLDEVPAGTRLVIGDPVTQKALEFSGEVHNLPFEVEWANLSGGPPTLEAFRAGALDLGAVADIPPIHAAWTGVPTRIVAAKFRVDPVDHPIYQLGVAPGSDVTSLADLRGRRIAYSPGQAQGVLVLRVLRAVGLTRDDVELVELASTGDVYPTALASGEVDVAPLGGVQIRRYLASYGADGARTLPHGLRDDPSHLYAPEWVLADTGKAAAIREYVGFWARATIWVYEHPREWIERYYVQDQGLTAEDGQWLVDAAGEPDIPARWDDVIARHQETVDLLAAETGNQPLDAASLYDRRYEAVAAEAIGVDR